MRGSIAYKNSQSDLRGSSELLRTDNLSVNDHKNTAWTLAIFLCLVGLFCSWGSHHVPLNRDRLTRTKMILSHKLTLFEPRLSTIQSRSTRPSKKRPRLAYSLPGSKNSVTPPFLDRVPCTDHIDSATPREYQHPECGLEWRFPGSQSQPAGDNAPPASRCPHRIPQDGTAGA